MKPLKAYTRTGIVFVIITGSIAHFLYDWSDHALIVGLFTPVNESIWEHMKLLFFRFKNRYPGIPSALCAGILSGTFLIPLFFYSYMFILGKDFFVLDISTFVLSILIAFWISYRLALSGRLIRYTRAGSSPVIRIK